MLDEVTRDVLDRLTQDRLSDDVSNATVNRTLTVVRSILRKAYREWDWLDRVPAVRLLKEPPRRVRWLTPDEFDRVLSYLSKHNQELARFAVNTGLRESNITGLEWSQVDLKRRVAWVYADESKTGQSIGVPLNNHAMVVLRQREGDHPRFVFTYRGKPIKKAGTRAWKLALDKARIRPFHPPPSMIPKNKPSGYPSHSLDEYKFDDFRWHDLRHTWATWHVMSGTPLNVLMELGGWSTMDMVMRYAHLAPDHLSGHAERITEGLDFGSNRAGKLARI